MRFNYKIVNSFLLSYEKKKDKNPGPGDYNVPGGIN